MRFPSFTNFFRHRRVRSDGALPVGVLPSVSIATPATRPASDGCINAMTNANVLQSDVFSAFIPTAPLSLPTGIAAVTAGNSSSHSATVAAGVHTTPFSDSSKDIVSFLMERVRQLEAELRAERASNSELPALKVALKTEREARQAAQSQVKRLKQELADSQADVIHARAELYAALNRQMPSNDIHLSVLASENSALVAEKLRYRKFIELMVSAGGHKPVLEKAYKKVTENQDPEAAFVMAIREAMARPGNIWRGLLEPVRGPRAPEEYLAQVTCTIRARREARDWKKKANFWKMTALEDARHLTTITPSVSNMSSIIEELSPERKQAMDKLLVRLRNEGHPVGLRALKVKGDGAAKHVKPLVAQDMSSAAIISELKKDEHFAEMIPLPSILDSIILSPSIAELATLSSSLIISPSQSSSTTRGSVLGNLPPLASQTFRETHSIRSRRNSHRLQLSISISGSLGLVSDLNGKPKRHSIAITPSTSKNSYKEKPRVKHRRRKVEILSAGQSDGASTSASSSEMSDELGARDSLGSVPSTNSEAGGSSRSSSSGTQTPHASNRADLSTSSKANASTSLDTSLTSTVVENEGDTSGQAKDSDKFSSTSRTTPEPKDKNLNTSGKTSPSRLPVLKKMRRLSISRPLLVDTTNSGTFTITSRRRSGFRLSGVWTKNESLRGRLEKVGEDGESARESIPRSQRTTRLDWFSFGTVRRARHSGSRRVIS